MTAGLLLTAGYMLVNAPGMRVLFGLGPQKLWFGIVPVASGVFGVALGVAVVALVSLAGRRAVPMAQPRQEMP